jgi:hypothetical protein
MLLFNILILGTRFSFNVAGATNLRLFSSQTVVRFVPQFVRAYPNQTFAVTVLVENVTLLYGIDIQITWNTTYLKYQNHTATVPVETFANGILHQPLFWVVNSVDENASMPNSEPETRYWIAVASMYPAPVFNGNGTVFTTTFKALNKIGRTSLNFTNIELINNRSKPISCISFNCQVVITFPGDVNSDLKVDGKDIAFLAKAYNTQPGNPLWNPDADVNNDGKVDGKDIATASKNYGKSA